jgi:arsenate reductase (thioredoxin)
MHQEPVNVLFVCSGNAGRSVMAEAILRSIGGPAFNAFSAGSHPTGRVNPMAILELCRRAYPTSGLESKSWMKFAGDDAPELDYVITVCAQAAQETMPQWRGAPQRLAWHFAPPGQTAGTDEQIRQAFSDVCAEIEAAVSQFVQDHHAR